MSEKKKLLIIGPGMEIGGIEKSLLGLLDSIDYSRYEVDLFLYAHTGELMHYINPNVNLLPENKLYMLMKKPIAALFRSGHLYVGFVRLFSKVYGDRRAKIRHTNSVNVALCRKILTRHIKPLKKKYDLALNYFIPYYYLLDKVTAKVKIGWVHTDYRSPMDIQDTEFYGEMYGAVDYLACVSEGVKKSFNSVYPKLASKTFVFENILFLRQIYELGSMSDAIPEFKSSVNLLTVGRYDPDKNFDRIPEMCKYIRNQGIDASWYIIGYGRSDVENRIKAAIHNEEMEEYVLLLGKKENPYPYIKNCDVFVLPSSDEGKSVVVLEAQALGKPVVITNYPTAHKQLEHGVDGIIAPMDFTECAREICSLINDKDKMRMLSDNCLSKDMSNSKEINKIYSLMEE